MDSRPTCNPIQCSPYLAVVNRKSLCPSCDVPQQCLHCIASDQHETYLSCDVGCSTKDRVLTTAVAESSKSMSSKVRAVALAYCFIDPIVVETTLLNTEWCLVSALCAYCSPQEAMAQ